MAEVGSTQNSINEMREADANPMKPTSSAPGDESRSSGSLPTVSGSQSSSIDSRSGRCASRESALKPEEDTEVHCKEKNPPQTHRVTFTVIISQAIPSVVDEGRSSEGQSSGKKSSVDTTHAQNYFHFEYLLLPEDEDPVKTDVVTFGMAAKIYTEKQEPKVLKTWRDNDVTWVAWTHCHTVTVTEQLLHKLHTHTLEVRVWDSKERVSTRARFDRPRGFRFPQPKSGEDMDDTGGVKTLVMKQSSNYREMQPSKCPYIARPLPTQLEESKTELEATEASSSTGKPRAKRKSQRKGDKKGAASRSSLAHPATSAKYPEEHQAELTSSRPDVDSVLVQVPSAKQTESTEKSYSRLGELAGVGPPTEPKVSKAGRSGRKTQNSPSKHSSSRYGDDDDDDGEGFSQGDGSKSRLGKKAEPGALAAAEHFKKYGVCCVPVGMAKLFAGMQTITERLGTPVPGIEDLFVTVSLSGPLLSEDLQRKLNPLVIKVISASNMPSTPLSFKELQAKCQPAYVKYQLYNQPGHCSIGRPQDGKIYWNDTSVMLAGLIEPSELREYLNGPSLEIELHDRDRIVEKQKVKPMLFGDGLEDNKISNVGTVGSRRTLHNPFVGRDKPWDPFGIARFDLSGLLLGQKSIHLSVPVHSCPTPDVLGLRDGKQDGKLMGVAGAVDGPEEAPLPVGHYLESHTMMKIKVEVTCPIVTPAQVASGAELADTQECPFSRLVYWFDYRNVVFLHKLQALVTEINAVALEMDDMPTHIVETALSTYKLSLAQQQSRILDIVTGFQVMDGTMHIFVLEGLRDKAIARLCESLPRPTADSDVVVLCNSDLSFKERLYGPLDVDLTRIKLHEPLNIIVQQALLYVRDMVPKPCFEALAKLQELTQTSRLRDAVKGNLFPSAQMIISMSREFGVPITAEDFEELQPEPAIETQPINMYELPPTSRLWTPLDNFNSTFEDRLQSRSKSALVKDYHKENLAFIAERSAENRLQRSKTMPMMIMVDAPSTHNYASQMLSSSEQAKEKLRKILAEDPDHLFTYCPDYHHSMTVVPVNVETQKKEAGELSKGKWRTPKGWTYPGRKTMAESNKHTHRPDMARAEDLEVPWTENSLYARLRPTLNRDHYAWSRRQLDMDLWTRPHPVFGRDEPITIQLAGKKLQAERQAVRQAELEKWKAKLITEDTRGWFHRCATETELRERGFKSSNQLARLAGLLKDPPQKYSLKQPGCALKHVPPLSVVLNPSVDAAAREAGQVPRQAADPREQARLKGCVPGPYAELSCMLEKNQIPVKDYQHQKFKDTKGQDFNVYHKERSSLAKRHIHPLSDDEYDTHLFRLPHGLVHTRAHAYAVPCMGEFRSSHRATDFESVAPASHSDAMKPSAIQAM